MHLKKQETSYETFVSKMDKISCEIEKPLVLWPDPSFLLKNVYFLGHNFQTYSINNIFFHEIPRSSNSLKSLFDNCFSVFVPYPFLFPFFLEP